jgi:nucleotide-binding universal stress UspA family protein
MYHVLIAVDEDEDQAKMQARAVSALPGQDELAVTAYHCFDHENPGGASATQVAGVKRVVEHFEDTGVEVNIEESSGDAATEIVEAANELGVDAICTGGRQRTPAGKALFGSVSQGVLLNADCTVIFAAE